MERIAHRQKNKPKPIEKIRGTQDRYKREKKLPKTRLPEKKRIIKRKERGQHFNSDVAQWWSDFLLRRWLQVRVLPSEHIDTVIFF